MDPARFIEAVPLPCILVDRSERIFAANTDARTMLGQGILGRNYVTMLRQPALLDAVEACLKDRRPRSASYLSNDGAQDTTFRVSCRFIDGIGVREAGAVVVLEQQEMFLSLSAINITEEARARIDAEIGDGTEKAPDEEMPEESGDGAGDAAGGSASGD